MSSQHSRVYRGGVLQAEHLPLEELFEHLRAADTVVWIDLCEPSSAQLNELAAAFDLHELAIEDVLLAQQRPKLDRYASHLFLATYAVRVDPDRGTLQETEIAAFVGDRWLVTVRQNDDFDLSRVLERWDRSPDLAVHGVGFLLYGLLDVVIDEYFSALEDFDTYYDAISDRLFAEHPLAPDEQRRWFEMRRAMSRFHRRVGPMREVISALMRREHAVIAEELDPYLQDLYDHALRVTESAESLRDLAGTIVETNLSLRDYRQNLIVKKVSSWAAIIAFPAMITGYFGMNVPVPGTDTVPGAIAATGILVATSVGLYLLFRRRDWL